MQGFGRRRFGIALAGLALLAPLVAGGRSAVQAPEPRPHQRAGYVLGDSTVPGLARSYASVRRSEDRAEFGIEELRDALSATSEASYVDLARFHGLRRGPGSARRAP